jgi:rhodanese-related sulfurtransferase
MKKYSILIFAILLTVSIVSCDNVHKANNRIAPNAIHAIAPKAMYDVLLNDSSAQLIDVRTQDEYAVSHLKDAQNICVTDTDFKQKVAHLDKAKPVYVYCKKGGQSAQAAKILEELGFTQVFDLQGGITNWQQHQLSTHK